MSELSNTQFAIVNNTVANWSLTLVRYFLLDPIGGLDTNVGYVDAAAGATLSPAGLAKQTIAGVMAIVPPMGNGRTACVLQMPGTLAESINTSGLRGYKIFVWRGSTDLTNDASDKITLGAAIAVAGPGGSSEFTATAGATTTTIPIAVGSFGAEPAALQFRVRFLNNTTTAALRNICRNITAHTTTVLTVGSALPATPASGDTFVIERPGAVVADGVIDAGATAVGFAAAFNLAGIGFTTTTASKVIFSGMAMRVAFCETKGASNSAIIQSVAVTQFLVSNFYANEAGSFVNVGAGLRATTGANFAETENCLFQDCGFMNASAPPSFGKMLYGMIGSRSYFAATPSFTDCGRGTNSLATSTGLTVGDYSTSNALTRINASFSGTFGMKFTACSVAIARVDFANCTSACIQISISIAGGLFAVDGCTGSTGNTDVGMHVNFAATAAGQTSAGLIMVVGRAIANTVTGTRGDVAIGGAQNGAAPLAVVTTWASFATTCFRDIYGNAWIGPNNETSLVVGEVQKFTNGDGTAHVLGELVRVSATDTVVRAQGDTAGNADGSLFVAVTPAVNAKPGFYVPASAPMKWLLHIAAPTLNAISYVSPGTAGSATNTAPTPATRSKTSTWYCGQSFRKFGACYWAD